MLGSGISEAPWRALALVTILSMLGGCVHDSNTQEMKALVGREDMHA